MGPFKSMNYHCNVNAKIPSMCCRPTPIFQYLHLYSPDWNQGDAKRKPAINSTLWPLQAKRLTMSHQWLQGESPINLFLHLYLTPKKQSKRVCRWKWPSTGNCTWNWRRSCPLLHKYNLERHPPVMTSMNGEHTVPMTPPPTRWIKPQHPQWNLDNHLLLPHQ